MNDGFVTEDLDFACALLYLFGEDALTRIERAEFRGQKFYIDAPSLDCESYYADFKNGELAVSDLKSYMRTHVWVVRRLKEMQRDGHMEYCSPSWQCGRG